MGPQNTGGRLCLCVPMDEGQVLGVHSMGVGMHRHGIRWEGALGTQRTQGLPNLPRHCSSGPRAYGQEATSGSPSHSR